MMSQITTQRKELSIGRALTSGILTYGWHFGEVCRLLLYEFALRLTALVPLLFLLRGAFLPALLLSVSAFVFVVLPARQSAADAMQSCLCGATLFNRKLYRGRVSYIGRVGHGLLSALFISLWLLPWLTLLGVVGVWLYGLYKPAETISGTNDVFTLLKTFFDVLKMEPLKLSEFFDTIVAILHGTADNAAILRILPHLLVIGAAGLILSLVVALAFHSGARHQHPYGRPYYRSFTFRLRTMLVWLLSALPIFLCLAAALFSLWPYVSSLIATLKSLSLSLPPVPVSTLLGVSIPLLLAALLQPLHSLIVGAWVCQARRGDGDETGEDPDPDEEEAPVLQWKEV